MALVTKGTFLNVILADSGGNKSTLQYNLNYVDIDALNTGVTAGDITGILADVNAVTDATVVGYTVGQAFAEDATFYGAAGSEVENNALIVAKVDGATPGKTVSLRVPAPVAGIFLGTTGDDQRTVDTADTEIRNYLANFADTGHILVSDGESIVDPTTSGAWKGKRIHRGSRNG